MSCLLRISGDFDPASVALLPSLEFEIRHCKGEPGRGGVLHGNSMIQCCVSAAGFSDLNSQFTDMVSFVENGGSGLAEFCKRAEFSEVVFDFGSEYTASTICVFRKFPSTVVAAAASCGAGLELSLYVTGEEKTLRS
jgi:hypothetical protein